MGVIWMIWKTILYSFCFLLTNILWLVLGFKYIRLIAQGCSGSKFHFVYPRARQKKFVRHKLQLCKNVTPRPNTKLSRLGELVVCLNKVPVRSIPNMNALPLLKIT